VKNIAQASGDAKGRGHPHIGLLTLLISRSISANLGQVNPVPIGVFILPRPPEDFRLTFPAIKTAETALILLRRHIRRTTIRAGKYNQYDVGPLHRASILDEFLLSSNIAPIACYQVPWFPSASIAPPLNKESSFRVERISQFAQGLLAQLTFAGN
jgi:hypothetical protein